MKATLNLQRGLVSTSILSLLLVSTVLVGCGTDFGTAPTMTATLADDDIERIALNSSRGVPVPDGASITLLGSQAVQIEWKAVDGALDAMVKLDGTVIARVKASDGEFTDRSRKAPGSHVYELCFLRNKAPGTPVHLTIDMPARNDTDDRRGTGDRANDQ